MLAFEAAVYGDKYKNRMIRITQKIFKKYSLIMLNVSKEFCNHFELLSKASILHSGRICKGGVLASIRENGENDLFMRNHPENEKRKTFGTA